MSPNTGLLHADKAGERRHAARDRHRRGWYGDPGGAPRETGRCLGYGRAGAGNPTSAGAELAISNQVSATRAAIGQSGIVPDLVMLTLAGSLGAETGPMVFNALAAAGIDAEVQVARDVLSAYFSATATPTGYLVLSGTGATSAHIEDGQVERVADGIGWLLGDEGSGFWIGLRVVRAVAAD